MARGRVGVLVLARFIEQGSLGVASLLLARGVGVQSYAPIATILIVNSFAITLSDFGLGTAVMASPVGTAGMRRMWRVRAINGSLLCGALLVALWTTGDVRVTIIGSAAIWLLSAEAFVRKSALIRNGVVARVATAEIVGSVAFAIGVGIAVLADAHALEWTIAALLAKHAIEVVWSVGWRVVFQPGMGRAPVGTLWVAQMLNYACSNVDFVLVGLLISSAAFSVYSLGFRVAAVVASQVSFAVVRVMLGDFADARGVEQRQAVLVRRSRQMFAVGAPASLLTVAVAPFIPLLLGRSWRSVSGVIVVLAIAVPWRMVTSVTLSLAMGTGLTRRLVGWEVLRLLFTVVALAIGALVSFPVFVIVVSLAVLVSSWAQHEVVARALGLTAWRRLRLFTPIAMAAVIVAGIFLLSTPL